MNEHQTSASRRKQARLACCNVANRHTGINISYDGNYVRTAHQSDGAPDGECRADVLRMGDDIEGEPCVPRDVVPQLEAVVHAWVTDGAVDADVQRLTHMRPPICQQEQDGSRACGILQRLATGVIQDMKALTQRGSAGQYTALLRFTVQRLLMCLWQAFQEQKMHACPAAMSVKPTSHSGQVTAHKLMLRPGGSSCSSHAVTLLNCTAARTPYIRQIDTGRVEA